MARVNAGRYTAEVDQEVVVFLIGMRINKPLKVRSWWPVFTAMPRMVKELKDHPDMGLLNVHFALMSPISPFVVQYWRSFEDLERFARDPGSLHLPAWSAFNQRVRDSGDVGIYHETYRVIPGSQEAVYGNMPEWGLAKATGGARPVGTSARTAAVRLGVRPDDKAPVEGY